MCRAHELAFGNGTIIIPKRIIISDDESDVWFFDQDLTVNHRWSQGSDLRWSGCKVSCSPPVTMSITFIPPNRRCSCRGQFHVSCDRPSSLCRTFPLSHTIPLYLQPRDARQGRGPGSLQPMGNRSQWRNALGSGPQQTTLRGVLTELSPLPRERAPAPL